ncbi:MAG: hypothetical protein LIP03_13290 [Bacteroidales bacterium]|nr:hypothetical protein [Bacteroidales bacterium]
MATTSPLAKDSDMGSKRGINYQWRLFFSAIAAFWLVIICMAAWQLYRVGDVKRKMVYDQLAVVGERVVDFLNRDNIAGAINFIHFIDEFYDTSPSHDMLSIFVRERDGRVTLKSGEFVPVDFSLDDGEHATGMIRYGEHGDSTAKYLYYTTRSSDGREVYVLLPYTKEVAKVLSASTTRFWLIFFSIAIMVTVLVYISAAYYGRNVRILRDFANEAAGNPDFVSPDAYNFPHDEFGEISRQIVNIYNQRIAEMEKREREHKVALHAIEEKERIKRELSGNINHELKTPVGVIQGYVDTMVDDPDMEPATRQRFLLKTQQNVHRLSSLIADITAITKLESGGKLVNVTDVNFHDLVFTFEKYLSETHLMEKGMTFSYDIPLNCVVVGNESLLTSVLLNFTKNSAAYSQGTMCRLEVYKEDDDFFYFRYYDDGIGVPPEHLPHMFERFYRVNSGRSREAGGTGLGLSIVEVAIHSFGGQIDVGNRYPSGLEFHFSLKKYKRPAPGQRQAEPQEATQKA